MALVVHRVTVEVREAVNTPDFSPATWIINPDLSALADVARRYWKVSGDSVLEMTQAEKDSKDAAIAQTRIDNDRTSEKLTLNDRRFVALVKLLADEFNTLRSLHGLANRTPAQIKNALQNEIDNN